MAANAFTRLVTLQDALHFLSRYIKYWRLGLLCGVLGSSLALAYFVYGKPSYYSKCIVEWSYLDLPIKSEISDVRGNTKWDNIYLQLMSGLQSRWLAERTAMRLGLVKNLSELPSIWSRFISKVKITSTVSNHLEIEVWVYEPRLAKIWPEAMLLEYHDYLTESRIKHRDNLIAGFTKEMDRIKKNLDAQVERDRQFESENKILEHYVANNKLEQLPTEMLTCQAQIDAMNEVEQFIEKSAPTSIEKLSLLRKYRSAPLAVGSIVKRSEAVDPFVIKTAPAGTTAPVEGDLSQSNIGGRQSLAQGTTPAGVIVTPGQSQRSEAWQELEAKWREDSREYERFSGTLLPGHEKMRELRKRIESYNFALNSEWEKTIASFRLERDHLKNRLQELQKQMPDYRKLIASYDDYKRDFRLDSSGRLAWEQAYVGMKARLTAMDYTGPEVQVDFQMKGFTEVRDDIPVTPNKQKLLTYALALSLGLGFGAPILAERLRFTSSFVNEAEKYCQYPACGIVPKLEMGERDFGGYVQMPQLTHSMAHANECFRLIRNSLPFYSPAENKMQVIMVTSARPNDGKSTVAMHLSRSMAEGGQKVLLIDSDMRRGSLHAKMGFKAKVSGMAELLRGDVDLTEVLHQTDIPNLQLLSRGSSKDFDYDLLSGKAFEGAIGKLRGLFDKIIIDTPPLLGVSDSLLITKVVDGVIFVIRSDQTTQRDIVTASEILHNANAVVYGFVLNAVDFSRTENYYYYSSYYSRYYEPSYYTALDKQSS
jgi:capsular exopolysaccharide synthesis family protein